MKVKFNKATFVVLVLVGLSFGAIVLGLVLGLQFTVLRAKGAVISNGRGCAEIGGSMLDNGGSAVDAAIATLLCEGVILPQSMGLGGGFIATIYTKSTGKIETVNARESAPAAAHEHMYDGVTEITGAIAGGVPGELLGYWEMHRKYGILPWKDLFQPAIKLCKEGHWVSDFLERVLKIHEDVIRKEPSMSEVFIKEDGTLYKEGDYMKRPQLGRTLEIIAEKGVEEMYDGGEIGKMFVEDIQELGGIITEKDLQNFVVKWESKDHVMANVTGGYTLYTTPVPSSGPLLTFMMNLMNEMYTENTNIFWQRLVETFKHAYGRRSNLGDMENDPEMRPAIEATLKDLKNPEFVKYIRTLVFDDKTFTDPHYYGANFSVEEDHGTANVAVLSSNGDAVTITSTVNTYFGAKVRSKRTGIILNDEMADFSTPGAVNVFEIPASPANFIKPGKRPMSSMCPAIILDNNGDVRLLVGAAGGTKITTSVAAVILNYLVLKQTLQSSIHDDRMHHQLAPMQVDVEGKFPESIQKFLESVGHKVNILPKGSGFAAVTAIGFRDEGPEPEYDRRRVGSKYLLKVKNKMNH